MTNVLLITLDQFRADCMSAAGHPVVRTPHLDALASAGVRFTRHYSQAAPCAPGRACLYTGMYQMNNRVVANGTPLDRHLDNIALAARRAGYVPTLFGYTDQSIDPRDATGPDDTRMQTYTGVLPGFAEELVLDDDHIQWLRWLTKLGYTDVGTSEEALESEPTRPAAHSLSTFLTDYALTWLDGQPVGQPWFAHLSYLRPHPPYAAAGHYSTMYDPGAVDMPISPSAVDRHPFHDAALGHHSAAAPTDENEMRSLRAQYYGMITEVDAQLGRVWKHLQDHHMWDDTFIVVTADHGEQLGDHGLIQKVGYFEQSYHVLGIVRDPQYPAAHGSVVDAFTENVDLFPTICDTIGAPVPVQCDGLPLTPFLRGETPPWWRDRAHWEYDWRDLFIGSAPHDWPWSRDLERHHLTVSRTADVQYVQFGDGTWRCFDLGVDPTARTQITDPAVVLQQAQAMLTWRSQHTDRTLTDMLVDSGGVGRLPDGAFGNAVSGRAAASAFGSPQA